MLSFLETNILLTLISFILNIFFDFVVEVTFLDFFCRQNLCYFQSFLYSEEKK